MMPSKSKKQHDFFEWIAHEPGAAGKAGVSKKVAKEFLEADASRNKRAPLKNADLAKAKKRPK